MKNFLLGVVGALLCAALAAPDAQAGRLGGGRSLGVQRSAASGTSRSAPPARPVQAQPSTAPAQPAAPPAPAGLGRWAPLLGGLALGGALGWLMGANGVGGMLVGALLVGLLAFVAMAAVRMLLPRREAEPLRMQYAGIGNETVAAPPPSQAAGFDAPAVPARGGPAVDVPPGFDVAGFLRGAKLNYMKLQLANDRGDLDELREFTSDELFDELKKDVLARGNARQQTDVLALNADLLEVVTEGDRHWASVRFSGTARTSPAAPVEGFEEVWNLVKPVDGAQGWQLAGIQQMH